MSQPIGFEDSADETAVAVGVGPSESVSASASFASFASFVAGKLHRFLAAGHVAWTVLLVLMHSGLGIWVPCLKIV